MNLFLSDLSCGNGKVNHYSCVRSLCNWLYKNGCINDNPLTKVSAPRRQRRLLPAISREQLQTLLNHCHCERDKAILSLLWYSGMRLSECAAVRAAAFNWDEGTVVILGKGNHYQKALGGNGAVRQWFQEHDSFEVGKTGIQTMLKRLAKETGIHCNPHSFRRGFCIHNVKAGLSTRVVQSLGGWETISMVGRYSKSLTFDDAFQLYRHVNCSEV